MLSRLPPFAAICGGILLFASLTLAFPTRPGPATARPPSSILDTNPLLTYRGSKVALGGYRENGCSAASCHGAQGIQGPDGKEHVIWTGEDAHAKAYGVLFNKRSVRMVELLSESDSGAWKKGVPAHESALCLKCHGLNAPNGATLDAKSTLHHEGVNCEACHGASEKWYTVHYQDFWKGLSNEEKASRYGLLPTKDLVWRTAMCATCHVGAADMDMNHDLIAAGHPALRTEMSAFHNHPDYGLHWSEKGYGKDFETRLWLIGQVGTMKASLELTRDRAKRADLGKAPWPELSESNCYSCHHDLRGGSILMSDPSNIALAPSNTGGIALPSAPLTREWSADSWRSRPEMVGFRPDGAKLGSVPWGTWFMPLADALRRSDDIPVPAELRNSPDPMFAGMNKLMHKSYPDPKQVVEETTRKIGQLDIWLKMLQDDADRNSVSNPYTAKVSEKIFRRVLEDSLASDNKGRWSPFEWESASQRTLSLLALHSAGKRLDPRAATSAIESENLFRKLVGAMALPPGSNSAAFYRPQDVREIFEQMQKTLDKQEPRR